MHNLLTWLLEVRPLQGPLGSYLIFSHLASDAPVLFFFSKLPLTPLPLCMQSRDIFTPFGSRIVRGIQHGATPPAGFHGCYCLHAAWLSCAVSAATLQKKGFHPFPPTGSYKTLQLAVSQCVFVTSLRYRKRKRGGGGRRRGRKLSCRTERQKRLKVLRVRERERERMREGMSNARRLLNRRPGMEGEGEMRVGVRESGSECI